MSVFCWLVCLLAGKPWSWERTWICCQAPDPWFSIQQRMCTAWIFNCLNSCKTCDLSVRYLGLWLVSPEISGNFFSANFPPVQTFHLAVYLLTCSLSIGFYSTCSIWCIVSVINCAYRSCMHFLIEILTGSKLIGNIYC